MGTKGVERKLEGFGKRDEVAAPPALGGDASAHTVGYGLSGIAVERGYTQSLPPRHSGHNSIRKQEPIRFAEMRGVRNFRRGRADLLCPPRVLSVQTQTKRESGEETSPRAAFSLLGQIPLPLVLRKDVILKQINVSML